MDVSRNVRILTAQGFLIGFSLWAPIAAIYYSAVSGSYALGLSVFSIAMVSSAVFEIPTGIFSDLIGRRYTTMLGGFFYTIAGILYAAGNEYWWLVVGAVSEGLARSFYSGNNDALLYDSLNKLGRSDDLAKHLGRIGALEQWALGMAALLGGMLAAVSLKLAMWLSVTPLALCFVSSFWLVEIESTRSVRTGAWRHMRLAFRNFFTNKRLRLISLYDVISFGLGESAFYFRNVFIATLWPMWAIGFARTLSNISAALSFEFSGKILRRFSAVRILISQRLYCLSANIIALVFPTVASPVLMATNSLWFGLGVVAKKTLFQDEFNDEQRATMDSLNSLARSLFFGVASLAIGLVGDHFGVIAALLMAQALMVPTLWIIWRLGNRS